MNSFLARQLVYGKLIINGGDASGFGVVGCSPDVPDHYCKEVVDQTFPGQIGDLTKFEALNGLTDTDRSGNRVFFSVTKSAVIDKDRGAFPVRHCLLITDEVVARLGIISLAKRLEANLLNRQFKVKERLPSLELQTDESLETTNLLQNGLPEYRGALLRVLDALFLFDSIIVVIENPDPYFRLAIAEVIYNLLPPSLQRKFSFSTNVYDPINQVKFRLKFVSQRLANPEAGSTRIQFRQNSTNNIDIKTPYVSFINRLLSQQGLSLKQISQYCQRVSIDASFTGPDAKRLFSELNNLLEPDLFFSQVKAGQKVNLNDLLDFVTRQKDTIDQNEFEFFWSYILNSAKEYNSDNLRHALLQSLPRLSTSFWDIQVKNLKNIKNGESEQRTLGFLRIITNLNSQIELSNQRALVDSVTEHYIEIASFDHLFPLLDHRIAHSFSDKITLKILESIFNSKRIRPVHIESLLEFVLECDDSVELLKRLSPNISIDFMSLYPIVGTCLFGNSTFQPSSSKNPIEISLTNLKREVSDRFKILLYLGIWGIKSSQSYPFSQPYLDLLMKSDLSVQKFIEELEKSEMALLKDSLLPNSLGALVAFLLINNKPPFVKDLISRINFTSWPLDEKIHFAQGFTAISQKASSLKAVCRDLRDHLEKRSQYQILILISENISERLIKSELLFDAIDVLETATKDDDNDDEIQIWGNRVIRTSNQNDTRLRNRVYQLYFEPYFGDDGSKFKEGLRLLIKKNCRHEDVAQIFREMVTKKNLSPRQTARLWYEFILFVHEEKGSVSSSMVDLLRPQISNLSDDELESLAVVPGLLNDGSLYKESLTRDLNKSPRVFAERISGDLKKYRINRERLLKILNKWQPQNVREVWEMVSSFEQLGHYDIAEKVEEELISRDTSELGFELIEERLKGLEQHASGILRSVLALSQNNAIAKTDQAKIELLVEKIQNFLKKSALHIAKKELERISKRKGIRGIFQRGD